MTHTHTHIRYETDTVINSKWLFIYIRKTNKKMYIIISLAVNYGFIYIMIRVSFGWGFFKIIF